MPGRNHTVVTYFILLGFSSLSEMQVLLFVLVLTSFTITLMGNILIMLITTLDRSLHTPMYFFLRNLSFLEICYTSVTIPKMLANLLAEKKSISFTGCATQLYFYLFFATAECYLLAAMAYDRYMAISHPLRYTAVMSNRVCVLLVAGSYVAGIPVSFGQTTLIFSLPFCGPKEIHHFFCDIPPLLRLACTDTYSNEVEIFVVAVLVVMAPFLLILVSYAHIMVTILKMSSAEGRRKAFSTCSSHLVVVTMFFGSGSFIYFRPKASYGGDSDRVSALLYIVLTPTLNPIIYSLRNEEVKGALRRTLGRRCSNIQDCSLVA
ncbi:olfactory receptor 10A7-like [Terrapene carolina triunguis]|uniref:Olfactory receptor n=1 Tax=Terrapene triunguis TaxID=2587831 RepID=A0A674J3P5_9SAUR|nr:olfactory receptor 10A7-like [Terrapene carolina triunguis]